MKLVSFASTIAFGVCVVATAGSAIARDQIQIVGSSTVFPFSTAVAERFGQKSSFSTPVVESTGSGGGMKLFCAGVGENTPDITNASRRIKAKELVLCSENGVSPVEVKVGFDGIVLANSRSADAFVLTRDQLFQALVKQLPDASGTLIDNPNTLWSDIDPSLPTIKIEVLGPPPTSGTRDAFVELVMEKSCFDGMSKDVCAEMREDGGYVEAGENDNLIVQKLDANPDALGIFGFSFLDQNSDKVQGASIDGVEPTFENIASGDYPVSRSLYFYVKKEHVGVIPGIAEFVAEFTDENTWGDEGYLSDIGLIPLPEDDRAAGAMAAKGLEVLMGL
ncbi:MAG: phosphate ABC transporter substrate-binding protein [Hyphomicrobiales bacterium]|nr:MAG: phosphate ABC transporter substrate-binding protein [Hyphomicrobiales bacterium]